MAISTATITKLEIENALKAFGTNALPSNAVRLFNTLGYRSELVEELVADTPTGLLETAGRDDFFNPERARAAEWKSISFLFQLTDREVREGGQSAFGFDSSQADITSDRLIESYIFFVIELRGETYPRVALADITREVNRLFPMPALVLFRHGRSLTFSVIDRRLNRRDNKRDVLERVTLVKDIRFAEPLRAHIDILYDLSLPALEDEFHFHSFVGLHDALKKRLDADALNRRFYKEVANWYFWASSHSRSVYPRDVITEEDRSIFLIRLLTRLIFCWFLQEKGLVPRDIFRARYVAEMLKDTAPGSGDYYRAFLQNLFFATLNQEVDKRGFRRKNIGSRDGNRGAASFYHYADLLKDPEAFEAKLREVPFVNGGLFDCLDDTQRNPNVRLDDFSEEMKNGLSLPYELFFSDEQTVDLSEAYGDTRLRREEVRGIINILNRYKFTVEESTPLEQEIALDPELLGRVFENLLASYNEDTRMTARKATGSFYTPREVVSYMTDDALAGYLHADLNDKKLAQVDTLDRLRQLFSADGAQPIAEFSNSEKVALVAAIDRIKILDPACGSGAFLMGALHRLVDLLQKLDPENRHWRDLQRRRATADADATFALNDKDERAQRLDDINEVFERNTTDYGRKLYLIENCIYGADIQPIACQIAKLRFFISLIVDQNINPDQPNHGVRPLPNLEAKVVAADALVPIERPEKHQLDLLHAQVAPLREQLGAVRHRYFLARTPATKAKCREQDAMLRSQIADLLHESGWSSDAARKMAGWNPYDQNTHATFLDPEWMFGVPIGKVRLDERAGATLRGNFAFINDTAGQMEMIETQEADSGFDVVVGNPPYIRLQTLKQKNPAQVEFLKDHYESARKGNYDIYVVFVERGMNLLKPSGSLAYILPHKFFNAQYGEPLRTLLARGKHLRHVVHFGDQQIFPGATNYVCLLFLSKAGADELRFVKVDDFEAWRKDLTGIEAHVPASKVTAADWNFVVGEDASIFNQLLATEAKLSDVADLFVGLQTDADDVFIVDVMSENKQVVMARSDYTGQVHEFEAKHLKPFLKGSLNIRRYHLSNVTKRLIFPYEIISGSSVLIPEGEYRVRFPATWEYLNQCKPRLTARAKGQLKEDWYGYVYRKNHTRFEHSKLLVPSIATEACFAADKEGKYYFVGSGGGGGGGYGVVLKREAKLSQESLLGILNSNVSTYYLKHVSTQFRGGYYALNRQYIEQLPIPSADDEQQAAIYLLVEYLLWLNRRTDKTIGTPDQMRDALMPGYFEQIINGLVYELFFADELHRAGLHPFQLVAAAKLPALDNIPEADRLATLRELFERLHDTKHPLRGCLHDLGSLETVRIIEGRA